MIANASHTYTVTGMTCSHCASSVREEVEQLDGVRNVEVDLDSGQLAIFGEPVGDAVRAAVAEAGYELSS